MLSIPIAVNIPTFKWQLELFWMQHQKVYGEDAKNRALAVIIKKNHPQDTAEHKLIFNTPDLPYIEVDGVSEFPQLSEWIPLNIQLGVNRALQFFNISDEQVIEVLDCDMFHMKKRDIVVAHNVLLCDPIYEDWHLKSLTENKPVIDPYIQGTGSLIYNGGFVPIVCTAKTMRKIINDWADIHYLICRQDWDKVTIKWWAGMYALQAACQRNGVVMQGSHDCHIPPINQFSEEYTIAHYSVDGQWADKKGPKRNGSESNTYTKAILDYVNATK